MLLSNLNLLATAPGGVAKLRELILTLAVQGKLVPQDPNDEPASVLLKKIRAEKDRLIAEGKIKRDKPEVEIADDQAPFGLPESWKFVRLSELLPEFQNGASSRGDVGGKPVTVLRLADIKSRRIFLADTREVPIAERDILKYRLQVGDILITRVNGSADIVGQFNLCEAEVDAIYCDHFIRMRVSNQWIKPTYLALVSESSLMRRRIKNLFITTAGQKTVNQGHIGSLQFGLPPLAEQSRIVTRVEELMRLCDALEAKGQLEAKQHAQLVSTLLGTLTESETPEELAGNWQRIATHFDLLLDRPEAVDALEQTILQLAVRGLLVPQDPQDEPASELLKKIRAEKDKLIAEDKIKQDTPLLPIAVGEQPFDLPEGWAWARFPELGEFGRGKSKHRPRNDPALFNPPKYPLIQTGEVSRAKGVVQEIHSYYSDLGLLQSRMWPKGTLCITIAANIAESAVLGFDSCFPDSVVGFIPARAMGNVEYFLLFVETARADLLAFAPATAQKNINLEILSSLLIPVPPLNELTRVVTRVATLRRICVDLRQGLTAARERQSQLAQSLVEQQFTVTV